MNTDVRCLGIAVVLAVLVGQADAQQFHADGSHSSFAQQINMDSSLDVTRYAGVGADAKEGKGKDCYCPPRWAHRSGVFAEYMLLNARDGEVAYGVGIDGAVANPQTDPVAIQVTPVHLVDPDYTSNFRVGGTLALSECTSIVLTYANFQSNTTNAVSLDPADFAPNGVVLRALAMHPFGFAADADFLDASANLGIDYHTADLDYRSVLWASELGAMNYLVGARYTQLNQDFSTTASGTGVESTAVSDVEFDGGGLRFGLDGERHHPCNGFLIYGKGVASFVAGQFRTSFQQGDNTDPEIVNTGWKAERIMTIVDMELGVGWQSHCGRFRLTTGYQVSMWFNAVTTDQWIRAVQQNNFVGQRDGMSYDTLMFDGLTARAEYRF